MVDRRDDCSPFGYSPVIVGDLGRIWESRGRECTNALKKKAGEIGENDRGVYGAISRNGRVDRLLLHKYLSRDGACTGSARETRDTSFFPRGKSRRPARADCY